MMASVPLPIWVRALDALGMAKLAGAITFRARDKPQRSVGGRAGTPEKKGGGGGGATFFFFFF